MGTELRAKGASGARRRNVAALSARFGAMLSAAAAAGERDRRVAARAAGLDAAANAARSSAAIRRAARRHRISAPQPGARRPNSSKLRRSRSANIAQADARRRRADGKWRASRSGARRRSSG